MGFQAFLRRPSTLRQPRRERCKISPPPPPPPTFDITLRFIYLRPSDKIYRNWKCRRYVCPFHAFFIFLLCSKLLFPPFPLHCQPPSGDSSSLPFASPPRESSLLFIATTLSTVPKLFHCREYEKERGSQKNFSTERMRECSFVVQTVGRRLAVCNSFSFRETEAVRLGFDRGLRANNSI